MNACHCCGHHLGVSVEGAEGARLSARLPFLTLDMHCHLANVEVEALVKSQPGRQVEADAYRASLGEPSFEHNLGMRAAIGPRLHSIARRLQDMDRLGIDIQVLSPSPMQYYGWAEQGLAEAIATAHNTGIADVVREHPERFVGLGAVPLQHPALAARALRHAVQELGLLGVEITSDPTGNGLDDPALQVFWQEAERLGAVIFLHPMGTSLGARVNRFYLSNTVGQPLETTLALSELIYGGVLDRHPGLKICAAHGGGYLPFAPGRFDHAHGVRPEAQACRLPPSEYLSRLWVDTVVFRPQSVRTLIDTVGVSQVVAGTDYPFDMGEYALHDLVRAIPDTNANEQEAILGGNAVGLLGLPASHPALVFARARIAELQA